MALDGEHRPDQPSELARNFPVKDSPSTYSPLLPDAATAHAADRAFREGHIAISPDGPDDTDGEAEVAPGVVVEHGVADVPAVTTAVAAEMAGAAAMDGVQCDIGEDVATQAGDAQSQRVAANNDKIALPGLVVRERARADTSREVTGNDTKPGRMLVDAFIDQGERDAFAHRQEALKVTAEHYGVNERTAVVVGGGALALQGINARVEFDSNPYYHPFDLDVLPVYTAFQRKVAPMVARHKMWDMEGTAQPGTDEYLPYEVHASNNTAEHYATRVLGYKSYKEMLADRVVVDGVACISAGQAALCKAWAARPKDQAGLVKAQVAAADAQHAITANPDWQKSVASLMADVRFDYLYDGLYYFDRQPETVWLHELVASDFAHPAFDDLRVRYTDKLEQAIKKDAVGRARCRF